MNVEFQRIARRDKKAFLSDQCKEIEENNRMVKTGVLKKIRDTKETFHAKMDTIKDRNAMDLTEAEDIKKRRQKYTEELWTEIRDIVQDGDQNHPQENKCKKAKWLSEEALQIAEKTETI